jgi:hypothetical protein
LCNEKIITKQFLVTPAAGKRLIARSLLQMPSISEALEKGTVVIVAGTTNGYVAEEILSKLNQASGFSRRRFFRGVTLPPAYKTKDTGRLEDEGGFPGDVVIDKGEWQRGKTIFDVVDELKTGDIIMKGANTVNLEKKQAAVYIGDTKKAGTINAAMQAVLGRRAQMFIPVGLEKRVHGDLNEIALKLNSPKASGPRLFPFCGNIITELEALKIITGAECELVAAGGVCGAEGSCWIAVTGTAKQLGRAEDVIGSVRSEQPFDIR